MNDLYTQGNNISNIATSTTCIPIRFRPYIDQWYKMTIYDNNQGQDGLLSLFTNGNITIGAGQAQTGYPTAFNNCGWESFSFSYTV